MRVLVFGATGYIGSRVIGQLISQGDAVTAAARDPFDLDQFWWSDSVARARVNVLDAQEVSAAVADVHPDAIIYLVHGMGGDDFRETDLTAARHVRAAIDSSRVGRVVYLSGIIPDVADDELSQHLLSRREVEEELSTSTATVITLRAALIIGAGSTSFELMTQLSDRMPVTVVPDWMQSLVEPVAVTDVVDAICGALTADVGTGAYDVGCGTPISYPDLIRIVAEDAGRERPQVTLPFLPEPLVAKVAGWLADVPAPTVTALMESLTHDMTSADTRWQSLFLPPDATAMPLDEAVRRAHTPVDSLQPPSQRDPLGALPGDPDWASHPDG